MYPKKGNVKSSQHFQIKNHKDNVKDIVYDKLSAEFGQGNQLNNNLIKCYVDDFFSRHQMNEGALRALKTEVKQAISKSKNEKQAIIQQLKALTNSSKANNILGQSQATLEVHYDKSNTRTHESQPHMDQGVLEKYQSRTSTEQEDAKKKSVYQVESGEEDEWATIVKYDTALYKKEQEQQKMLIQMNKQKIKEELDKQLIEKEKLRKKQKEEEQQYAVETKQRAQEFQYLEDARKEQIKQKQMEEKKLRDQQVHQEKQKKQNENNNYFRYEQLKSIKQEEEDRLQQIKMQMKKETETYNLKRHEQKEKFQKIIKENEKLRQKAIEDLKLQKEYETKMQQLYIKQQMIEEEKREQIKKEREDRIKQLMSNYSENVLKNEHEIKQKEDLNVLETIKLQERQAKELDQNKKLQQKEQMESIKKTLHEQIQDKKMRISQEISESRKMIEKQQLEDQLYREREQQRKHKIKEDYVRYAEHLKEQMGQPKISQSRYKKANRSMHEKMSDSELLHNKGLLKKIHEDSMVVVPLRKKEIVRVSN